MTHLHIHSMYGLGDNIFIRPFVRAQVALNEAVSVATPWPELFEDLGVQFVPVRTNLRTQAKNTARQPGSRWMDAVPKGACQTRVAYGHQHLVTAGSITKTLERQMPLDGQPYVFDLPAQTDECQLALDRPVAIIRPVTTRQEWYNIARSPRPEYVGWIAQQLMATHHVVVIADLVDKVEWIEGVMPPHHQAFVRGELNIKQLMAYVRGADVVVGGVGWIVPMAIAARTPAFIICGGQAQHNSPAVITDPRQDLSRVYFAKPDHYCNCSNMRHSCNKTISDLPSHWTAFQSLVTISSSTPSPVVA